MKVTSTSISRLVPRVRIVPRCSVKKENRGENQQKCKETSKKE